MKKFLVLGSFCAAVACAQAVQLRITNAASYQANSGIQPGALITAVSISGHTLSNVTMTAPDPAHLPTSLGGVTVTVNGVPCGVYYISPMQVSARLDPSVQTGQVDLAVTTPIGFASGRIIVEPRSSPAIFTLGGTGSADGAIVNAQTFSLGPFSVAGPGGATYLALFVTGLDTSAAPTVWVGGFSVPVQYFGDHPLYQGLQQINVQLTPDLAGLGRVEVVVEQRGRRSNAAEVVLLPPQGIFASDLPNQFRSREAASIAWVPGTSLALVADENDDVLRVVDVSQRRVTRVIALPDGAQPVAIGVWGNGSLALVAERGRGSVVLVDLATFAAVGEFPAGRSPSGITVSADQAVVINADSDSATFFDFRARQVTGSTATGRLPRGVTADAQRIYVTNESDGTISVLDWALHSTVNTLKLGVDVRPGAIQLLPDPGFAVVAEPSAGPDGKLIFVDLGTARVFSSLAANPERTGGASSIALAGSTLYLANQTGASVTAVGWSLTTTSASLVSPSNIRADLGVRAVAVDSKDNLLLALNEGVGTITLIDLNTHAVAGRIDAVRSSPTDDDDHADRLAAPNLPTISSVGPSSVTGDSNVTLTITGTNLYGASTVLFLDPQSVSALARGKGNQNRGVFGNTDAAIQASNIQVSPDGKQITLQIHVDRGHAAGPRLVRVVGPNGESSLSAAPALSIAQ